MNLYHLFSCCFIFISGTNYYVLASQKSTYPSPSEGASDAHLAVVHLVAQPGVEALRMGLPRLVELQGDMGVHAEGEVVVDDVQGDVRLAAVHMVIGDVLVGRDLHPPAVHEHALRHPDLPQHLPDRFVRVALKENRL